MIDWLEGFVCHTIGCTSPLARHSRLPYRLVCHPWAMWRYRRWLEEVDRGR